MIRNDEQSILHNWNDEQSILHNWNDEECVNILKKCKEAITSKGKGGDVIAIDVTIEHEKRDYKSNETLLYFDMMMVVLVTGRGIRRKGPILFSLPASVTTR